MDGAEHRVAIVLDPNYGERIFELARECHVWLVRSASNYAAAQALWHDPAYSAYEGVSTFSPAETLQATFAVVLDLVEMHHAGYGDDPPVSVLNVIGLDLSAAAIDELDVYEYRQIEPSTNGFVARRN